MTDYSFQIRPIVTEDREAILEIFNYYVLNSFAAYLEKAVGDEFFDLILAAVKKYPSGAIIQSGGGVAGFGFLHPYHAMLAFKKIVEISYFLRPEFNRLGLGTRLLNYLLEEAQKMDIECVLANISSLNQPSIQFHQKNGFVECGCFKNIGIKNRTKFDVIWMQRFIHPNSI